MCECVCYCAYFYYVNKLYVHVCVLERAKHSFFALPNPLSCSVMNKICLNQRGAKEAIYIRALNPSLNRDGGRYNLPSVLDNIIKKRVKADRQRREGASLPSSHTTSPMTSTEQQTDEADRNQ